MGPTDRLPGLHALRFLAATVVFVLHAIFLSANWVKPVETFVSSYFQLGVQLFYVVSAFALMHSTRLYADRPDWMRTFYIKRYFRIAPLFYIVMAWTIVHLYFWNGTVTTLTQVALNVTFLNNFVPRDALSIVFAGWSVSVEMLFYVIFPVLFMHVRTLRAGIVLLAVTILIGEVARALLDPIRMEVWFYGEYSLAANLRYFAFGMLAFLAYERLRESRWGRPDAVSADTNVFHAVCFSLSICVFALILATEDVLRQHRRFDMVLWGALFCVVTVWASIRPARLLSWAPIQFLGERSYSLYLLHVLVIVYMRPVAKWIYDATEPSLGAWAVAPAVVATWIPVVAAASLTYLLIERPGMALGKSLDAWLKARSAHRPGSVLTPAQGGS